MYCTPWLFSQTPVYPLKSANVPLGVYVLQVGNPWGRVSLSHIMFLVVWHLRASAGMWTPMCWPPPIYTCVCPARLRLDLCTSATRSSRGCRAWSPFVALPRCCSCPPWPTAPRLLLDSPATVAQESRESTRSRGLVVMITFFLDNRHVSVPTWPRFGKFSSRRQSWCQVAKVGSQLNWRHRPLSLSQRSRKPRW